MKSICVLLLGFVWGRRLLAQEVAPKPVALKPGAVVEAEISADSPVVHTPTLEKSYVDEPVRGMSFLADLSAGPVTIELRSYFFDAYLVVRDGDGKLLAEDDDGLLGTHAQILLKSDAAATYEVIACALHDETGALELRIVAGASAGMLSLTRSFREAGARTVISSLWQVRDDSTKDLMLDFYDRLWSKGESKLDALRGAQIDMLRKNREKYGNTRPATWGAFVLTGTPNSRRTERRASLALR